LSIPSSGSTRTGICLPSTGSSHSGATIPGTGPWTGTPLTRPRPIGSNALGNNCTHCATLYGFGACLPGIANRTLLAMFCVPMPSAVLSRAQPNRESAFLQRGHLALVRLFKEASADLGHSPAAPWRPAPPCLLRTPTDGVTHDPTRSSDDCSPLHRLLLYLRPPVCQ
jgi:hypothetical protein